LAGSVDEVLVKSSSYLMDAAHGFRIQLKNYLQQGKARKGVAPPPVEKPTHATVWIAKTFPPWQSTVLTTLKQLLNVSK